MRFFVSMLLLLTLSFGMGPSPAMATGTPCHASEAAQTLIAAPANHAMHQASAPETHGKADKSDAICKALCAMHCLNGCPGLLGPENGPFEWTVGKPVLAAGLSARLEGQPARPPLDPPRTPFV